MRPVESSCPGGSEFCVIKGGRRCFRISNGRPKFTLFKNNKKPICCVQIKCKSRNFQNWACPHKSLLPKDYGKKWFTWASSILNYFEQPKHGQKMLYPHSYRFSKSWGRKDSVGTCPENFSRWKFSGMEQFTKKTFFLLISVSACKKNVADCCGLNFDATDLPNG